MEFELKSIIKILWHWAWLLVVATVLAAVISYSTTSQQPRIYIATTTLMVGQVLQATNPAASDFSTTQQLAQTYVQLVRRQPLLQATAEALDLNVSWEVLVGQVSAAALPNTQLMQISVVDSSPQRARIIADELAHQLILQSPTPTEKEADQRQTFLGQQLSDLQRRISESQMQINDLQAQLTNQTSARLVLDLQNQIDALQQKTATWQATYATLMTGKIGRTNNLSVVEPATGPAAPISPNVPLNVLTASAIGLALALVAALLIEYVDDTVRSEEEVARTLKLRYLGGLARIVDGHLPQMRLVTVSEPQSSAAEAFRVLRTGIQLALRNDSHPRLLVTSAGSGEGKTTTAANLGVSLAEAGKTVILCDMDLRRPFIHRLFGLANDVGLSALVLDPMLPLEAALRQTAHPSLWVLPSGAIPTDPAELLTSEVLLDRLSQLSQHADIIIFDSPAIHAVADAQIIASFATAVLLVVDAKRTRRAAARRAVVSLEQVGVRILGVALNRATDVGQKSPYSGADRARRRPARLRLPAILRGSFTGLHR